MIYQPLILQFTPLSRSDIRALLPYRAIRLVRISCPAPVKPTDQSLTSSIHQGPASGRVRQLHQTKLPSTRQVPHEHVARGNLHHGRLQQRDR
jgi:hypothetical protein